MISADWLKENDYKNVFYYFNEISAIPRGSGNCQGISDYLVNFAKEHGLEYIQDEALNVIIRKPASKGYEDYDAVILQGHMDMVCVKEPSKEHDFLTQGLELIIDGNRLMADRTSLGADDGIAVAYMLALLSDKDAKHPMLEAVITTEEETGMDGAKALDFSKIKGKYLLNIDSEEDAKVWCSCAGGLRMDAHFDAVKSCMDGYVFNINISGLLGGHSGADIDKNRANAVLVMSRILYAIREKCNISLVSMNGGEKDNAIPSFCNARIAVLEDASEIIKNEISGIIDTITKLYIGCEPGIRITVSEEGKTTAEVLDNSVFDKVMFLLITAPNGIVGMSSNIEGLVETSLNLGIFEMNDDGVEVRYALRSSSDFEKQLLKERMKYIIEASGAECNASSEYPAWEYRADSKLRELFKKVHFETTGIEAETLAIHAGLECAVFAEKAPYLDMISFGAHMEDIHSPKECLYIDSAIRNYELLEKILESFNFGD